LGIRAVKEVAKLPNIRPKRLAQTSPKTHEIKYVIGVNIAIREDKDMAIKIKPSSAVNLSFIIMSYLVLLVK
jgi:CMP-N-acetylneuraminic acid synthetase